MNILITGVGGPTPRSIIKQLRFLYPDAKLYGTDINSKAIGFFMPGILDGYEQIPKAREKGYFEAILEIIQREEIDFAFVQPEYEVLVWGKYFNENGKYPCPVLIPPVNHVEALMDKSNMAELLAKTDYIPKTLKITPDDAKQNEIAEELGYPCWIRASVGSGGLGSLKLNRREELDAWLFIHKTVPEFTVSEFLPGRHLANQMLYVNGQCVANAGLHCAEYVMANIAPSKVTGNTSYGLLINEKSLLDKCEEIMDYIQQNTGVPANGVYSFDFKEDASGALKVTEINIRHMAYTGIMSRCGFDIIKYSVEILSGNFIAPTNHQFFFEKEFVFLRDVDVEPLILDRDQLNIPIANKPV